MWLWVIVLVVIIGAIAVLAAGRGDALVEVYDDRPDATLPTGRPLTADDLATVRFSTAVRGYRMDEVDALLTRVQDDLIAREPVPPPVDELDSHGAGGVDDDEVERHETDGPNRLDLNEERDSSDSATRPPTSGASAGTSSQ